MAADGKHLFHGVKFTSVKRGKTSPAVSHLFIIKRVGKVANKTKSLLVLALPKWRHDVARQFYKYVYWQLLGDSCDQAADQAAESSLAQTKQILRWSITEARDAASHMWVWKTLDLGTIMTFVVVVVAMVIVCMAWS